MKMDEDESCKILEGGDISGRGDEFTANASDDAEHCSSESSSDEQDIQENPTQLSGYALYPESGLDVPPENLAGIREDPSPSADDQEGSKFKYIGPLTSHSIARDLVPVWNGPGKAEIARLVYGEEEDNGAGIGTPDSYFQKDDTKTPEIRIDGGEQKKRRWGAFEVTFMVLLAVLVVSASVGIARQGYQVDNSSRNGRDYFLRDPATGEIRAYCDLDSGDVSISGSTIFINTGPLNQGPPDFDISMLSTESVGGPAGTWSMQDGYASITAMGESTHNDRFIMATGVNNQGGALTKEAFMSGAGQMQVHSDVARVDKFILGQGCDGNTCSTEFVSMPSAPIAAIAPYPDPCRQSTSLPVGSIYYVHRDMSGTVQFVGGASTLGDATGGRGLTFVSLCVCIINPNTMAREQFCSTPLTGASRDDYGAPRVQVV